MKENKLLAYIYVVYAMISARLLRAMFDAAFEAYNRGREIAVSFGMDEKAAFSTSLVGAALGIVILAIIVLDVAIPVVTSAIGTANLTGTTLTIANLIPMFFVLGLFVMVAVVFVIRWL